MSSKKTISTWILICSCFKLGNKFASVLIRTWVITLWVHMGNITWVISG